MLRPKSTPKLADPGARMGEVRRLRPREPVKEPTTSTVAHLEDAALVVPATQGEDWAAEEIWRRFANLVRGIVQRTLGPGPDARDLVQEAFLQFFGSLRDLREPSSLRPFLIGITIRVVRSELRRRRVRRFLRLTNDGAVPEGAMPELDAVAREAVRRLYEILDGVPDEERLVFTLRHIEGLELTEVSDALGLSLATVKRRLQKVGARITVLASRDPRLSAYVLPESEGGDS